MKRWTIPWGRRWSSQRRKRLWYAKLYGASDYDLAALAMRMRSEPWL
jgi:hypothetical protein